MSNGRDRRPAAEPTPPPPAVDPSDLLAEGARARKLSAEVEGATCLMEGIRMINNFTLAHVLFALWDSGFYEYSLSHARFSPAEAAEALHLDAEVLASLMHYLVGCGVLRVVEGLGIQMELTEYGSRLSNVVLRGTLNINLGGYGSQVANIGPLLRKERTRDELEEGHSGFHSGLGTEQLTSVRLVPAVQKVLAARNLHSLLHLACGSGGFLAQMARTDPLFHGIGIDKAAVKIAGAEEKVRRYGLESRIRLIQAEIGVGPLPLDEPTRSQIEVVASIYLLHEIGRYGRQRIVDVLRQIKESFPGKLLLFSETMPPDTPDSVKKTPGQYSQLDYLLIHRLRGKGMPLPPAEWKSIVADAGIKLIEFKEVYSIGLFVAEL
jgi:SAM-dependent methyltransferase